ncbi:mycofactocin biosynthesis peptidyl-dipeptidase MftE [Rhodococcus sp. IC4_135]|uniref:mycofactocin biosynthesis peptidyl-dipeptidase MftE n=1 Tax=Rhodococcus sp. IC4_135 TaxID=2715537 RepID=UPI0014241557|nr:mycofactocin biosynthesis peptidyl-dipeptidase MftE [Rhodococcus sp. IC4_135]
MSFLRDLAAIPSPALEGTALTVVVPVGSFEQHGPHLPLDTDTRIARAVAQALPDVVVAPAVEYGASGEHEGFAGTISIGAEAMETLVVEYGRSAFRWTKRVLFVNGHGGNGPALAKAVALLRYEGRDAAWVPCAVAGADAHAGHTETSLLLHLSPDLVHMSLAETGNLSPIADLMPGMRSGGMVAVSQNGVLGNPVGATAEDGAYIFGELVGRVTDGLARWEPGPDGRLR